MSLVSLDCDDRLGLYPLVFTKDRDKVIVGVPGRARFISTSSTGAEAIRLLQKGLSLREATDELRRTTGSDTISLRPLLRQAVSSGFVASVNGESLPEIPCDAHGWPVHLPVRLANGLFSRYSAFAYGLLIVFAAAVALTGGWRIPSLSEIVMGAKYAQLAWLTALIGLANSLKHELAHCAAAARAGVAARIGIGHRFVFPVIQADLTDLWTVAPARRYLVYSAGMLSDLAVLAAAVIVAWATAAAGRQNSLRLVLGVTFFVALSQIVWQFNAFVRTDVYFILTNAIGQRNLHSDALRAIAGVLKRCLPAGRGQRPRIVRASKAAWIYAGAAAAGYAICTLWTLYFVVTSLHTLAAPLTQPSGVGGRRPAIVLDASDRLAMGVGLACWGGLVGASVWREKTRKRVSLKLAEGEAF